MEESNDKRKRAQDDSEVDSPESKIPRVDSDTSVKSFESQLTRLDSCVNSSESQLTRVDSGLNSSESQLTRVDSGDSCLNSNDSALDSAGAIDIDDDLLKILNDTDNVPERDSAMQGLDSVIKSFEEEILAPGMDPNPAPVPESGEMQPNLGYLLEASDDELGLPPTVDPVEVVKPENHEPGRVGPEGVDLTGFMGFEDDIPTCDPFGFGSGLVEECDGDGGFVAVEGLFDYSDPSDILWRSESLQAM